VRKTTPAPPRPAEPGPLISGLLPPVEPKTNGHEIVLPGGPPKKPAPATTGSFFPVADATLKPGADPGSADWLFWQLADSAFPTGGFAHSTGLEAARHYGEIRNRTELNSYLETSLRQLGRSALPFVTAAYEEPERLDEFDRLCDVFLTNHVANRASRLQGRAFLTALERIFKPGPNSTLSPAGNPAANGSTPEPRPMSATSFSHFAPVFGAGLRRLEVPRETTIRLFFFSHLRGLLAAAVRLNIIGPMEAQTVQHRLAAPAQQVARDCEKLSLTDIAQTAPLLDLWQGAQDRLYSRLFQS
jgi:urease accessory protein